MPACPTKWWRCATAPWAGISPASPAPAENPTARRRLFERRSRLGEGGGGKSRAQIRRHAHRPRDARALARRRHAHDLCLRRARSGRIQSRPFARRHLRARRTTGAGDRSFMPACCGARIVVCDDSGSARADDRVLAQADGLEGCVRAAGSRERNRRVQSRRPRLGTRRDAAVDPSKIIEIDNVIDRRPLDQPALPARTYSRRLVRHPRPARPRHAENSAAPDDRAHLRRRRARRSRRRGSARADRRPRALAQRRQRGLGRNRRAVLDRAKTGGRAARRLAQALRAAERQRSRHERLSVVGSRFAGAHQERRHDEFHTRAASRVTADRRKTAAFPRNARARKYRCRRQ